MSSSAVKVLAEPVRTLGFAAIGVSHAAIGTGFNSPIRMLILQNFTDQTLMFSFDGVNDHLPLLSNGYIVLDITGNKTNQAGEFSFAVGTHVYVRLTGGAATLGDVYVSSFYGFSV